VEYTSDVRHVAGRENMVADALSRYTAASVLPVEGGKLTKGELAAAQRGCEETQGSSGKMCK